MIRKGTQAMEKQKKNKNRKEITGGTVVDYVQWRGDLSFADSPWNEIDSVIAALISYANFGENELTFGNGQALRLSSLACSDLLDRLPQDGIGSAAEIRNQFLRDLAVSRRFQEITVLDQVNDVDPARSIQFSAFTMDVPGVGAVVVFRGTDTSLVGWKEDFMLSYMTPIPAQTAALAYLEKAAAETAGPLILVGHSKGGNLALYSAVYTRPEIRQRLRKVYSFDGPGLDDGTVASEDYRSIEPLIRSYVPTGSIIGMLLNYHPIYHVVLSKKVSLLQHDPFNWLMIGTHFLEEENLSNGAQIMDRTIHEWLKSCTPEQREIFVTAVFSLLDKKDSGKDDSVDPVENADDNTKKMIQSMINRLISIHAGESWDINIRRPLIQASENLRLKLKAMQGDLIRSETVWVDNRGNGFGDAAAAAEKMAESSGLSRQDALRLVLFTEEMLSMISTVAGELKAAFWIERIGLQHELQLAVRTEIDRKKKKRLKASAASVKIKGTGSFQEKLRAAFERALVSDSDDICFDLPEEADRIASGQWDGYERSVLVRLADSVRIAIHGKEVRMTVRKDFS